MSSMIYNALNVLLCDICSETAKPQSTRRTRHVQTLHVDGTEGLLSGVEMIGSVFVGEFSPERWVSRRFVLFRFHFPSPMTNSITRTLPFSCGDYGYSRMYSEPTSTPSSSILPSSN